MSFLDILAQLEKAESKSNLNAAGRRIASEYGFSHFYFTLHKIYTPTNNENITLTNFPRNWQEYYARINAEKFDPHLEYAFRSVTPVTWYEIEQSLDKTKESKALNFMRTSSDEHSFRSGITLPLRSPDGEKGMLALSRQRENHPALIKRLPEILPFITTLALYYCSTVNRISNLDAPPRPKLTPRELEIMRWVAEGKDNEMIASILNISVSAVAFHIRNIYKKLGAANRANAVARAILTGSVHTC